MAFVNQEKKRKIAAELKKVVPASWKYSLRVNDHAEIVMTIWKGPEILMMVPAHWDTLRPDPQYIETQISERNYRDINVYHWQDALLPEAHKIIGKIMAALNTDNFDKSDTMTDYFHVGHYVSLKFGNWDKPYEVI